MSLRLKAAQAGGKGKTLALVLEEAVGNLLSANPTALGRTCKEANGLRIEIVRVLEQYVQLMLLGDQLAIRRDGTAKLATPAQQCIDAALRVLDAIDVDIGTGPRRGAEVFSLRARLMMHQSVLMSRQSKEAEALRCLSLAEAELGFSDPSRGGIWWAVLDLHRSEAALASAQDALDEGRGLGRFGGYCRQLRGLRDLGTLPAVVRVLRAGGPEAGVRNRWRTVLAALKDATAALKRAEALLTSRRRNVWWVTWFFHRRLKVIELELWATLGDNGQPVPYLGFESACRLTSTMADDLLDNTLRMVRLDAYRLATVVETYSHCVLALHIRLGIDPDAEPLPRRQKEMWTRLNGALARLRIVREERRKRQNKKIENSARTHDLHSVFDYVGRVERRVEEIIRLTERVHQRTGGLLSVGG
jgi:hypothetical protein